MYSSANLRLTSFMVRRGAGAEFFSATKLIGRRASGNIAAGSRNTAVGSGKTEADSGNTPGARC